MKPKILIISIFLFLNTLFVEGQVKETRIEYQEKSKGSAQIYFSLGDYLQQVVPTPKGEAVKINVKNGSKILTKGAPDLPKFSSSLIIPDEYDIQINVVESKFIEISDILIAPSKGIITRDKNPESVPFVFGEIYESDEFFPKQIVDKERPYILRDYRGQTINIYPFQYNPVSKVLRVYTELIVKISEDSDQKATINVLDKNKDTNEIREFAEIYKSHFLNYSFGTKYTPLVEGEMLIISPTEYLSKLDTFINWKNQRGLKTEIVEYSTIGSTAEQIKTYVIDYYNNHNLVYLLLIGDAEDIPSLYKSGDSDAAYGHILGDDSYTEIFVGRFSAENETQLETQVNRSIYYERDIETSATWLSKAIGISSDEGGGGQGDDGEADREHMDNIRTDLLNYGYDPVEQIYDPGASATTVSNKLNEGIGLINYVGHGSDYSWGTTGFSVNDVNNLTNENMLPFIFDVACVNGNFHGQTCFAESWLRATNNGNFTGAVAIIASTINQSWESPMDAQDEMNDILIESYENNIKRTFAGIVINGGMHMIDEYGSDGSDMANTWTIFGDPSLLIRTKAPLTITIAHNDIVFVGSSEFEVTGDDGVVVALSSDDELISMGKIENGNLSLSFDPLESEGVLTLTATGYNKVTYQTEIQVETPDSPYVVYRSNIINDTSGNNNQQADFGESILWDIQLRNISDSFKAYGVTTKLRAQDSLAVITDSVEVYGDLDPLKDSLRTSAYSFELKDTIKDQQKVRFKLIASGLDEDSNPYEWTSNIKLTVNAPDLKIENYFIDDQDENNNGILDPGETAKIKLVVSNSGHSAIANVSGKVTRLGGSTYFSVVEGTTSPVALEANQRDTLQFVVSVDSQEEVETPVEIKFDLIDNNYGFYSVSTSEQIILGEVPVALMSDEDTVSVSATKMYFFDSGGEDASYSPDENYTITFIPAFEGNVIKVSFLSFDVENNSESGGCYDYLKVYNGASTSADLIDTYCNENPATEFIANNLDGALTFVFYSDGYVENTGWKAEVTAEQPYDVTFSVKDGGNELPGVKIEFNNTELLTNENGEAVFNNILKAEKMPYVLTMDGYETIKDSITVDGDELEEISMSFVGYNVHFIVKNGQSKISDATILFNSEEKTTDSNGEAIFKSVLPASQISYSISKEGYNTETGDIEISTESKTINVEMSVATTIEETVVADFKIYPNPSNGVFSVELLNNNNYKICIYDVIGSVVYENEVRAQDKITVDLSSKAKGIYFISVKSGDLQVTSRRLLIK